MPRDQSKLSRSVGSYCDAKYGAGTKAAEQCYYAVLNSVLKKKKKHGYKGTRRNLEGR